MMIFMVVQLYQDREMALWAGALMAVNPFHVWLSRTARPYTMIFLLALLASYFFLMLVLPTLWALSTVFAPGNLSLPSASLPR